MSGAKARLNVLEMRMAEARKAAASDSLALADPDESQRDDNDHGGVVTETAEPSLSDSAEQSAAPHAAADAPLRLVPNKLEPAPATEPTAADVAPAPAPVPVPNPLQPRTTTADIASSVARTSPPSTKRNGRGSQPAPSVKPQQTLKRPFTLQISLTVDDLLRDEVVRRTEIEGRMVPSTELIAGAFDPANFPRTAEEAEALVASIPQRYLEGSVRQSTVRFDDATRAAIARIGSLLFQARSPLTKRDLFCALIVRHLGLAD